MQTQTYTQIVHEQEELKIVVCHVVYISFKKTAPTYE